MIFIGLGSNLGDRKKFLRRAFDEICRCENGKSPLLTNVKVSSIYESEAMLPENAPDSWNQTYFNMVLAGESSLQPLELMARLQQIEKKIGRTISDRWAPREIDLDILGWDSLLFNHEDLKIPHPGLTERPFAIMPLLELAPTWIYPGPGAFQGQFVAALSMRWNQMATGTRRLDDSVLTPVLMGVLNITPDSFSDGGLYFDTKKAVDHALKLVSEGARIIDIGAESTRPGASVVSEEEEWVRLKPVIEILAPELRKLRVPLSVDTRHPMIAKRAIEAGARLINDVTGFENKEMLGAVTNSDCDLVFMHSLGVPPSRDHILPPDQDPVDYLFKWAERRITGFEECGVNRERLIFDPGIGFGKKCRTKYGHFEGSVSFS